MTATIYTFHRASDHSIIDTAEPGTLQQTAQTLGRAISREDDSGKSRRAYVHNGTGIVAAGLCQSGLWHDVLRDDYMTFDTVAREHRTAAGYPND